jgi:hypothetical protein
MRAGSRAGGSTRSSHLERALDSVDGVELAAQLALLLEADLLEDALVLGAACDARCGVGRLGEAGGRLSHARVAVGALAHVAREDDRGWAMSLGVIQNCGLPTPLEGALTSPLWSLWRAPW